MSQQPEKTKKAKRFILADLSGIGDDPETISYMRERLQEMIQEEREAKKIRKENKRMMAEDATTSETPAHLTGDALVSALNSAVLKDSKSQQSSENQ